MKEITFSKSELERYSRHLIIPEFNIEGQKKLKAASVLVVGTGGLGAPLLQYLTAAGIGTIGIVDFDFPRAARNRDDIEEIVTEFNSKNLDGIMIVMLTYGPGMRTVRAWQHNNLPLLLANIQPVPEVTTDWNMDDLTYNQGIHAPAPHRYRNTG